MSNKGSNKIKKHHISWSAWLPDRGVQLVAVRLAIIQLCKQREEDLHAADRVYATLDRVSDHSLHVLQKQTDE